MTFERAGEQILTRLMRTFDGNGDNMLARTEAELALRALRLSATEIYTGLFFVYMYIHICTYEYLHIYMYIHIHMYV